MFAFLLANIAAGLTPTIVHAALVEKDLNTKGDALITLDTESGLEWLDVTATVGLSYNEAKATTFVTESGFRHATVKEVRSLYEAAELNTFGCLYAHDNFDGATLLLKLLGSTGVYAERFPVQGGWSDLDPLNPDTSAVAIIQLEPSPTRGNQAFACEDALYWNKDSRDAEFGNYLVRRSPIPKPSP